MSIIKAKTMPGVMELLPMEQIAFNRMLGSIRSGYERFGFLPIETPVMELTKILLTKEGGETERQVYFVQSTGSIQQGKPPELALRFDLTVPLARYVAEHESNLNFPFRRYQIQKVYRGERSQKGRFREFYQCDIDVIGKDSLDLAFDAEIPMIIHTIFKDLGIGDFTIKYNNRKLMAGFLAHLGVEDEARKTLVMREVDKLEKVGAQNVKESLCSGSIGLQDQAAQDLLEFVGKALPLRRDTLRFLNQKAIEHPLFNLGLEELTKVTEDLEAMDIPDADCLIDLSIARGLDYYTGTVYETILDDHPGIGSVCSGGRYDNLATHYSRSKLPGVGISIGATRLFYQLQEAGVLPATSSSVQVLITRMDDKLNKTYLRLGTTLRKAGINTEVQVQSKKLGKQLQYAAKAGIRFAVIVGEAEEDKHTAVLKDLLAGTQQELNQDELTTRIKRMMN